MKTAVLEAVTHAISRIYILAITGAALSIVLAVFMSREKVSNFRSIFSIFMALSIPIHVTEASFCLGHVVL